MKNVFIILFTLLSVSLFSQEAEAEIEIYDPEIEYYKPLLELYDWNEYQFEKTCKQPNKKVVLKLDSLSELPKETIEKITTQFDTMTTNYGTCYKIITWDCGSPCQMLGLFKAETGQLVGKLNASYGFDYRQNSSLIIVNPPIEQHLNLQKRKLLGEPEFYKVENDMISKIPNKNE